ncbi:MAG: GGDEF domain-containing protein [Clostridiales bacterium]|nr:GGDEF domain-containing protein [Clostridiales bacterium]
MSIDSKNIESILLQTIGKYSQDTVYFKDKDSKFIWVTESHARQVGAKNAADMVGKSDFDYFPKEFAQSAKDTEMTIMASGEALVNMTEELVLDDETIRYFMASKYPLYDDKGEIIGTWGISRDITDHLKLENDLQQSLVKLSRLARVDDLSGLYNRRYFYEKLDKMSSFYSDRKEEGNFALVVIDVDDMTSINDRYGQQNGDLFLRTIASIMLSSCRKPDTCFRTGGDEFAVILPGCDKIHALGIAKRIVEAVAGTPVRLDGDEVGRITISAGVVAFDKDSNLEEFLATAERKLNKSKRNGKNQASM